ncbi:unnamed protein product [Amoebophrya sp. A25]|nr:unnamed protein product [Amoebophrya sp. A25]|eukprot:GSA25T00004707001.1
MLSFSELRNRALQPRWFNFYGYNPDEIQDADVKAIAEQGEEVEANWYKGKLLISARVEKLDSLEELQSACVTMAKGFEEPATTSICLLADIYMVAGAVGRECQVEITLGTQSAETDWVYPNFDSDHPGASASASSKSAASSEDDGGEQDFNVPTTFLYSQKQGRPQIIQVLMPEDPISQPDCLINVWTRGVMSGRTRLGYAKIPLSSLQNYEPGNPRIPFFTPLKPMPWNGVQTLPVSLLMTLEKTSQESATNARHMRKMVKNMQYVLRVYMFGARHIDLGERTAEPALFVRATCAGASTETRQIVGDLRPTWMRCMELCITLMSDHPKKPPTMEPITVSLCNYEGFFSQPVIGKAICKYTYMRQKDILDEWEPYQLVPQWVKLYGGQFNSKPTGEICVAFELLRKKDVPELPPSRMWPKEELYYQPRVDFCRLRKATLHISVVGLRDLKPLPGLFGGSAVQFPVLEFKVRKLKENVKTSKATGRSIHEFWSCFARYETEKPDADPTNPADRNKRWESKAGKMNHEIFQYRCVNVLLPEDPVFYPWVTIKVGESNGGYGSVTDIAECRVALGPLLPWVVGAGQQGAITGGADGGGGKSPSSPSKNYQVAAAEFLEPTQEEREAHMGEVRKSELQNRKPKQDVIAPPAKVQQEVDSSGVHVLLRKSSPLPMIPVKMAALNMKLGHAHGRPSLENLVAEGAGGGGGGGMSPGDEEEARSSMRDKDDIFLRAVGEIPRAGGDGGATRGDLQGRLEDNLVNPFISDFYYRNLPLTRNRDVVSEADSEASYDPGVYGFVKVAMKLTAGHMEEILGHDPRMPPGSKVASAYQSDSTALGGDSSSRSSSAESSSASSSADSSGNEGGSSKVAIGGGNPNEGGDDIQDRGEEDEEGQNSAAGSPADKNKAVVAKAAASDVAWIRGAHDLEQYAWDEQALRDRYKSSARVPNRVRVRLYFVKGICIYGKGRGFASPYLEFTLGNSLFVSMRNMVCENTNTPTFYRLEERDIRMPEDSQLEVALKDYDGDMTIGATTVDLEDRWHSDRWRDLQEQQIVPSENRGLWTLDAPGMSRGSINCWVEMLDSVKSSEQKAATLTAPPAQEIEIRIVIWDTKAIKIVDDDHTDVTLSVNLDCAEYFGEYPSIQDTDVHYGSKTGDAVFNWRIVYNHLKMPTKSCTLQISVLDYNMMSGNVFIADVNLDLKKYLEKVARDMDAIQIESELEFKASAAPADGEAPKDGNAPEESCGSVHISLWVMTQSEADGMPVGLARNEPNVNPQLITPLEGRGWGDVIGGFSFKLPNFGLLGKLMPVIIVSFAMMIGFRYMGLL